MTESLPSWRYEEGGTKGSWEGGDVGSPVSGFVIHAATGEGPDAHTHPYPETFIVDRAGRIVHHHIGYRNWDEPGIVAALDRLMNTGEWRLR